jgi:hypothetical protein
MTGHWTSPFVLWLADVYVMSSLLLVLAIAAFAVLRQPARRMTVARAAALGLAVLAISSAIPGWPRQSWKSSGRPENEIAATRTPEFSTPIAGSPAVMPGRPQPLAEAVSPPAPGPVQTVSLPENADRGREGAEPLLPIVEAPPAERPNWTALLLAGYVAGSLAAAAWLLVGAMQAALLCRRSREAPESLEALLRECLSKGDRTPRLRLSSRIAHPVAIGRLLLPIFFAHPFYWWLRRRIRLDQEVLADAAAAPQLDRTAYAEVLLAWARQAAMPPGDGFAASLALWEHPSQLRRRIAVLLDPELRVEPRCPRGWKLSAWGGALSSALLLSFATLHPFRGRTEAPLVANPQPAVAADQIMFQGRVVDPEGKPYPGARILFGYYYETADGTPAAPRATSGPDGRFRFSVDKAFFNHIQNRDVEPWNEARLLAVAPSFGLGLSDSKEPDASHDVTLRLVRDDVPITGRLLDLEGRPVEGAAVGVKSINAAPSGDLNLWFKEARAGKEVSYTLEQKHLPVELMLGENECPMPRVRTDRQGRFRIEGVGRERLVGLTIEGESVRQTKVNVMTRAGDPLRARGDDNRPNPSFVIYQPARFELSVAPGRVIEGTVCGKDNGEPIARAYVTVIHRRLGGDTLFVRTRTDDAGHFRLASVPIEAGSEVYALPQDQPYFGKLVITKDGAGRQLLTLDFRLNRGVWAEGKATDKTTGQPVQGAVRYAAVADNPHVDEATGYRELAKADGPYPTAREIKRDGSFRVPVLPGRGALIVSEAGPKHPGLTHSEWQSFRSTAYVPAYGPVQDYKPSLSATTGSRSIWISDSTQESRWPEPSSTRRAIR